MNKGWPFIKRLIKEAEKQKFEQPEMPVFLKEHITTILDTLEDMVQKGIDLSDRQVVSNLKNLELALHQIPQRRIYSWDAPIVLDEFEEFIERFYVILSTPKQNAETSFTTRWIINQFESYLTERNYLDNYLSYLEDDILEDQEIISCFKSKRTIAQAKVKEWLNELEEKKKNLEDEKEQWGRRLNRHLERYLTICSNLNENGSDMLRSMIAAVTEDMANALYSDARWEEARLLWKFVITLLEQNNVRIMQREGRLMGAKDHLDNITKYSVLYSET